MAKPNQKVLRAIRAKKGATVKQDTTIAKPTDARRDCSPTIEAILSAIPLRQGPGKSPAQGLNGAR